VNSAISYGGGGSFNEISFPSLTINQANCLVIAAGAKNKTATSNGATWNAYPTGSFNIEASSVPAGIVPSAVYSDWIQTTATSIAAGNQTQTIADGSGQTYQGIMIALSAQSPGATAVIAWVV
jgi:hypothetical protein